MRKLAVTVAVAVGTIAIFHVLETAQANPVTPYSAEANLLCLLPVLLWLWAMLYIAWTTPEEKKNE